MEYITVKDAAERLGMSPRRIQQLCQKEYIPGAIREGRRWLLPDTVLEADTDSNERGIASDSGAKLNESNASGKVHRNLPIGISDFRNTVSNYYYVDKTLMIKDFLDRKVQVSLFTRPRCFGKTLNMDMLRVFFEKSSADTSVYFRNKKIWACGEVYRKQQGKYPVIYLSFKDVKYRSWDKALANISGLMSMEFDRHRCLLDSDLCSEAEKRYFTRILNKEGSEVDLADSLKVLSKMLSAHYGVPAMIMIDEYDTPVQEGYFAGYYDQVIEFIRNLFSGGFKDNPNLAFGFLTGILRVAKENIFSGMNNLKVYSITDSLYSRYFGFTREEVKELLSDYSADDKLDEVCHWYGGYLFGNDEIFNPWSVINYIAEGCIAKPFWQYTGSNDIIEEMITTPSQEIWNDLFRLVKGESVITFVDTNIVGPAIRKNKFSIYSFLLMTGYLKISSMYPQTEGGILCEVSIPNREISRIYASEIIHHFAHGQIETVAIGIQQALYAKDLNKLQNLLEDYVLQTVSSFDPASEVFYQGFMIGICAIFDHQYYVRSTRENGVGRFNVQLEPIHKDAPGFIFELKIERNPEADLDPMLREAMEQMYKKRYDVEMQSRGIHEIIKIAVAFAGKHVRINQC